jgi:hypothetical protein
MQDICLLVLHRKLVRDPDSSKNSKYGAAATLDWGNFHHKNLSGSSTNAFA